MDFNKSIGQETNIYKYSLNDGKKSKGQASEVKNKNSIVMQKTNPLSIEAVNSKKEILETETFDEHKLEEDK